MELAHCIALFAQEGNAPVERVGNAKVVAVELILAISPLITQRRLYLLNGCNQALGLLGQFFFFSA